MPSGLHGVDHHRLAAGELVQRVDVALAQMVAGDVQQHADIALVEAEAPAHDAAARHLEHGVIDRRLLQHGLGRQRPGIVAAHDDVVVDLDRAGAGHADLAAGVAQQMRDQPRRGRLAVRARDRGDRDAPVAAVGEQHVDHRLADRARLAVRRRHVHAEAGAGIDLDHAGGLLVERLRQRLGEQVDADDVEAHQPPDALGGIAHLRVDVVGQVGRRAAGRDVRGRFQQDHLAVGNDAVEGQAGLLDEALGLLVDLDLRQQVLVPDAAAGILVLLVDQLPERRPAVADDMRRAAAGGGDELAVDDQQSVILAPDVGLDDDLLVALVGGVVALAQLGLVGDVGGDAAAVIADQRLGDDRVADTTPQPRAPPRRLEQMRPCGTGMPASPRICLVQSLSSAMLWPMMPVFQVTVAWKRCCLAPWPSWM